MEGLGFGRQGPPRGFAVRDGAVVTVPGDGSDSREVFKFNGTITLREDRRGLYLRTGGGTNTPGEMMFYRLPNGPVTKLPAIEAPSSYGFSISPDGRYLIYSKFTSSGSDLMLVENFK